MQAATAPRIRRSSRKIRRAILLPVAFSLTALAVLAIAWYGRPRRFEEIAIPVCTVREWQSEKLYPSFDHFYWISGSELLIRANLDAQPTKYYRQNISVRPPQSSTPVFLSLSHWKNEVTSVSPDGKWVIYPEQEYNNPATKKTIARLAASTWDGSRKQSWEYPLSDSDSSLCWTPDSRRIVIMQSGKPAHALVFSLDSPDPQCIPLPSILPGSIISMTHIVGFTPSGNAILQLNNPIIQSAQVNNGSAINYPRVSLVELNLNQKGISVPPRFFTIAVPPAMDAGMLFLSPKGDRIFWGGFSLYDPPLQKWLHRWIPAVKSEQRMLEKGWISDLDGSHVRELGYYEIPGDPNNPSNPSPPGTPQDPPWILDPKWSPDGKSIAVLYKDKIYTIPVD